MLLRMFLGGFAFVAASAAMASIPLFSRCDGCTEAAKAQKALSLPVPVGATTPVYILDGAEGISMYLVTIDQEPGFYSADATAEPVDPVMRQAFDEVRTFIADFKSFEIIPIGACSGGASDYVSNNTCRGQTHRVVRDSFSSGMRGRTAYWLQLFSNYVNTGANTITVIYPNGSRVILKVDYGRDAVTMEPVIVTLEVIEATLSNGTLLPLNANEVIGFVAEGLSAQNASDLARMFTNFGVSISEGCRNLPDPARTRCYVGPDGKPRCDVFVKC